MRPLAFGDLLVNHPIYGRRLKCLLPGKAFRRTGLLHHVCGWTITPRATSGPLTFGIIGGECTLFGSRTVCYQRKEPSMEHVLRKHMESRLAYKQRRKTLAFGVVLALSLALALAFVLIG